jgi:hypothetical protein
MIFKTKMTEIYLPEYAWEMVKTYIMEYNYKKYTKIRNEHGIGNYIFEKKCNYQKRKNTKESLKNLSGVVLFDTYFYKDLIPETNYVYVDEYLKLIPIYLEKTKHIIKREDDNLYWHVFHKDPTNWDKYPKFLHNGCFYIAMLYYGYEYKKRRNGLVDWNCEFKKEYRKN